MMDLTVSLRLADHLTKPARDAVGALDKLGAAATRITSRLAAPTRAVRGLASVIQGLKAADGAAGAATGSTARLRGAMASLAPAGRTAAAGVGAAARGMDRLAGAADRAERATSRLRTALATAPADGGFAAGAEGQLRSVVALQRTAIANMRTLAAGTGSGGSGGGTGGGGRRGPGGGHGSPGSPGMMGHAFLGATSGIVMGGHAIRELYEQGAQRADEYQKMAAAGVSAAQIARNRNAALATSRLIGGSGINGNLATLRHLRFALGSDEEAERALTPVAQASQTMRWMNPEIDAEGNAFAMAKAAEMKGVSQDPAKFRRYMGVMANTAVATGGKTTGQDFRAFTAMSKGAATFLSEDAYAGLVSSIGGELGASKTGNALAMATRANIGGVMTAKGRGQLAHLGLWDKRAGTIVKADDFQRDPHQWVEDNLVPVLKANGMLHMNGEGNVDPEKSKEVGKLFAKMFSNSNVASLFTLLTTQGRRYEKDQALRNKVAVDNFALQQKSPTFAMNAMTEAFKNMLGTMSEADMPQLVSGLNALTGAFNGIAAMNPKSLGLITELGAGFLAIGPAIWAARLAYMTFILPVRQLPLLLRGGATAMGIMRAETVAATVATNGLNASASVLATTLGRALAAYTALSTGLKGGGWLGQQLDREQARSADLGKSDRTRQGDVMTAQRYLAQQNAVWNDPKTSRWTRFMAGQEADKARRFLDARGAPYEEEAGTRHGPAMGAPPTMVPYGGARALGGQVRGGMAYLVGEHGPEILQANTTGSVATASRTARMLGQLGEAGGSEDHDTASSRVIRALGFQLTGGLTDVARAIERLGFGRVMAGVNDGENAAGGGGLGGRRGFMARGAGGGSEGVTLPDGATGPRVGLGRMGAVGAGRRGFAKFDSKAPAIMGALMTKYGLTKEQAAGVVGNLGHESGGFTAYHEGGQAPGRGGVGWAQWTGPRRRAFERWVGKHKGADGKPLDPTSDEASWRFLTEGDPETARAIAAVKRTHTAHDAMVAFEDSFERAGVKAYASRDRFAARAYGMTPVAGVPGAPEVPPAIADRAKVKAEADRAAAADRARPKAGAAGMHVGVVNVHVAAQPHHDERQVADMVHRRFNDAVHSQLSDGAYA